MRGSPYMISVALAAYNGEKYIHEQLDSILRQTYRNFELIICDDCSTDSTWKILQEYAEKDDRIHCYLNEKNLGFKKNFEKAIGLCGGEYIALSDQDDIWTDDHLEVLYAQKNSFQLVCSHSEHITHNGNKTGYISHCNVKTIIEKDQDAPFFSLLFNNFVQGCTVLIDKKLINEALPIPDEVEWHDYWFAIIAAINHSICFIDKITVLYRRHDNNVTNKKKSVNVKRDYHTRCILQRINIIEQLIIRFELKLTVNQQKLCNLAYNYFYLIIKKRKYFYRIVFFFKYYKIMYLDKRSLLLFISRILFNIIFLPASIIEK
jgi:glycosyltransferase involved in cell wall biosynthesis